MQVATVARSLPTPRATPMFNPLFPRPPLTIAPYVRASLMGRSQGRKLMGCFAVIYSQFTPLHSSSSSLHTSLLLKTVPKGRSSPEGQITINTTSPGGSTLQRALCHLNQLKSRVVATLTCGFGAVDTLGNCSIAHPASKGTPTKGYP